MQDPGKSPFQFSFRFTDNETAQKMKQPITERGGTVTIPESEPADFLAAERATSERLAIARKSFMAVITPARPEKIMDDRQAMLSRNHRQPAKEAPPTRDTTAIAPGKSPGPPGIPADPQIQGKTIDTYKPFRSKLKPAYPHRPGTERRPA